jgi:O-antigen ligase
MFFCCFACFLVLAPLYKAGNRPLPLLLLELAAIGFLFVIVVVQRAPVVLPRSLAVAIGLLLVYPLVQLVPLPDGLWRTLPGHGEYAAVLDRFAASEGAHAWRAISVVPAATERGWLALLPPLACLLGALRLSAPHAARLLLLLTILAGAQGVLGLLQVGPSGGGMLYFGNEEPGQYVAIGTFVNRNHLAALLAMTLPVIVGLFVYSLRPGRHTHRRPVHAPPSEVMAKRTLLLASAVVILVCLLFTRSRAGIASGLVGLACSAFVLVRAGAARRQTPRMRVASYTVIGLVVVSIGIALAIGIGPLLRELEPGQLQASADFRWSIYAATLRGAFEFLPFGSGLSTYADVFPRFQVADVGGFIDYAHNDYLQAFMELGVAAPVIVALLFAAWLWRLAALLRDHADRSFTLLQLGAGLGMVPMVLHSMFDFALHMPANAMWFATLAGVMLHPGVEGKPAEGIPDEERTRPQPS